MWEISALFVFKDVFCLILDTYQNVLTIFNLSRQNLFYAKHVNPPRGGLPYERDGDTRRKIRIKTLKESNLGVAQALFDT